ncbi:MAG: LysM peptidoglycan-binding domain-containing protein [Betaproteobacteria bacterium]|nr:LysM peptidoglycan-binding domain-containing protein [Betaproteobacteria bacterium]
MLPAQGSTFEIAGTGSTAPGNWTDTTAPLAAAAATTVPVAFRAGHPAYGMLAVERRAQPAAPDVDLWSRIRAGFRLPEMDSSLVAVHARRFSGDPDYLARIFERARLYLYHIVDEVEKRNMPLEIALLPAIESAYYPHAHSRARAMGLWQFIAPTARLYGIKIDWWYDGRRDVLSSTRAALDYLQKLHDQFDGDWFLALAAYNAGEGGIQRRIEENRRRGRPTGYENLRLVSETRNYVPKLIAFVNIISKPESYGVSLPSIPNAPYFAAVDAGSQIDLTVVSQVANVPMDELRSINAGFNRIATPPDGPHHILVPANNKQALVDGLRELPEHARVRWQRHHVRSGDTLGTIAHRYGVSVQEVQRANELRGTLIRAGRDLMIPISSQRFSLRVAATPIAASKEPSSGRTKIEHRVREGESLWSIARHYDVRIAQLSDWNSITERDNLRVNQKLEIWTPARVD